VTLRSRLGATAAFLAVLAVAPAVLPGHAGAQSVEQKRQEAERIADQLEALQDHAFDLGEEYDRVEQELASVTTEVAAASAKVAELESRLGGLRSSMSQFAVRSYVYGSQSTGLALLLSGDGATEAAQRARYTEVVLQGSVAQADELETVSEDATRERKNLEAKLARQQELQDSLSSQQAQVEESIGEYNELQTQVRGELAELVAQEQARRAAQEAARAQAQLRSTQQGTVSSGSTARGSNGSSSSGGSGSSSGSGSSAAVSGPRPGVNVPSPSPGAGGAVAAALSQVGVGYRYASAIPGEAFDCSGLTAWAWGQAGVGLPRNSRSQAAAFPAVPSESAQPGDLIFYYSPISHVGMYVGGGQLVHATRPGDVVKVAAVHWDRVVKVVRPG
jgi:cell wall-associated NlpC family hydrolase